MDHFKPLVLGSGSGGLAVTSKLIEYLSPLYVDSKTMVITCSLLARNGQRPLLVRPI